MRWDLICFDFWRTLFVAPTKGSVARHNARVAAFARALEVLDDPPHPTRIGEVMMAEWGRFNSVHVAEERTLTNPERVAWLAEQLACAPPEGELAERLVHDLEESLFAGPPELLPGMAELVRDLAERADLAIISDTSFSTGRILRRLLESNGIAGCFEVMTFSDEVGRSKPNEAVFHATCEALGRSPERAVHIGDREDTDVAGALRSGFDAVLFLAAVEEAKGQPAPSSKAQFTAHSVEELRSILFEA